MKNYTVYEGKPYLKIERNPYYIGRSKFNKVIINLGFIKLVSRVKTEKYNLKFLKEIAKNQNVILKAYTISDKDGSVIYYEPTEENLKKYVPCFIKDTQGVAEWLSIYEVFMCYRNKMLIDSHGTAKIFDDTNKHIRYYGYSHRGGQKFVVGDYLFDNNWEITVEEAENSLYEEYFKQFIKAKKKKCNKDDDYCTIMSFIPFRLRGSKKITSLEEAKQSALNMSDYLS